MSGPVTDPQFVTKRGGRAKRDYGRCLNCGKPLKQYGHYCSAAECLSAKQKLQYSLMTPEERARKWGRKRSNRARGRPRGLHYEDVVPDDINAFRESMGLRQYEPGEIECQKCDRVFSSQDVHSIRLCDHCRKFATRNQQLCPP